MTTQPEEKKPEGTNVEHRFMIPGTMVRIEGDDWDPECNKPGLQRGEVYILGDRGVDHFGYVVGCFECQNWKWFTLEGKPYHPKVLRKQGNDEPPTKA